MLDEREQEDNARLLVDIVRAINPTDMGNISGFCRVRADWFCPSCLRNKSQMARLDRNNNLLCAVVEHHDHWGDLVHAKVAEIITDIELGRTRSMIRENLKRFDSTLICNDCNVAEPAAKSFVGAPDYFSFSATEIARFIVPHENAPHDLRREKASEVYESVKPQMLVLRQALAEVRSDTFEQVGDTAARVMQKLRAMKEAA